MYVSIMLSSLMAAAAMGAPLTKRDGDDIPWKPADGTTVSCDKDTDKVITFFQGPEDRNSSLIHACSAMMPVCAYPPLNDTEIACIQPLEWELDGPQSKVLNVTVTQRAGGNKLSDWAANFTVTPAAQQYGSAGVFWSKGDCQGYFNELLSNEEPGGCMIDGSSPGPGNMTVGGSSSLKGAVFGITFVERK